MNPFKDQLQAAGLLTPGALLGGAAIGGLAGAICGSDTMGALGMSHAQQMAAQRQDLVIQWVHRQTKDGEVTRMSGDRYMRTQYLTPEQVLQGYDLPSPHREELEKQIKAKFIAETEEWFKGWVAADPYLSANDGKVNRLRGEMARWIDATFDPSKPTNPQHIALRRMLGRWRKRWKPPLTTDVVSALYRDFTGGAFKQLNEDTPLLDAIEEKEMPRAFTDSAGQAIKAGDELISLTSQKAGLWRVLSAYPAQERLWILDTKRNVMEDWTQTSMSASTLVLKGSPAHKASAGWLRRLWRRVFRKTKHHKSAHIDWNNPHDVSDVVRGIYDKPSKPARKPKPKKLRDCKGRRIRVGDVLGIPGNRSGTVMKIGDDHVDLDTGWHDGRLKRLSTREISVYGFVRHRRGYRALRRWLGKLWRGITGIDDRVYSWRCARRDERDPSWRWRPMLAKLEKAKRREWRKLGVEMPRGEIW